MKARTYATAVIATLLFVGANIQTPYAQDTSKDFQKTMQGLLLNMQGIVEGIMTEDYEQIRGMAEDIAFHSGPSPQRSMAIAHELGIEVLTFRMFGDSLRQSALELKEAAVRKNTKKIIEKYTEVTKNCVACHSNYRKQLRNIGGKK